MHRQLLWGIHNQAFSIMVWLNEIVEESTLIISAGQSHGRHSNEGFWDEPSSSLVLPFLLNFYPLSVMNLLIMLSILEYIFCLFSKISLLTWKYIIRRSFYNAINKEISSFCLFFCNFPPILKCLMKGKCQVIRLKNSFSGVVNLFLTIHHC